MSIVLYTVAYKTQSLDSGDRGHKITVAVSKENKPANRFKNITVCKYHTIVTCHFDDPVPYVINVSP